ncbi:NADH dehydrogenase [ubiquinone] 1 alpha subcomplex subunit 11-like [Acanthaster planci]|uniref:NADH dehydrogenase [ubiquinone] 1 alpha subcomplex subunit 11 n=1 Tax=Acanthaster planci TaxID=133434 RepID=A0A8B7Y434_ACAPL|nr:NADH dehydrogenase [ubiquinone] 1 alpha subcomplex subunit 11-like [Acanthaster planci]
MNIRYDNIDGKEPVTKILETTATGAVSGAGLSAVALSMHFPKNFTEAVGRSLNHTATLAALGAVFGAGTTIAASVRDKDGPLNYFIGGCMAGAVLGAKYHSYSIGTSTCVGFGGWAAIYKLWRDEGWGDFIPKPIY